MDRQTHWQGVHTNKYQDVSWWQAPADLWLDLFDYCTVTDSTRIVDVGSGAATLFDVLLERGQIDLVALDISAAAIDRLAARLRPQLAAHPAAHVEFVVGDVLDFAATRPFDIWHDRAVFHFLTDPADQAEYVASVRRNLRRGGQLILATFSPNGPSQCSGLDVARHDIADLQRIFGADFQLLHSEERLHTTPAGGTQAFSVAVFQRS